MKQAVKATPFKWFILIILIVAVGIGLWRSGRLDKVIPSTVERRTGEVTFIHTGKQFATTLAPGWTAGETKKGLQTLIYPANTKLTSGNITELLAKDIILLEVSTNQLASYEELIKELKLRAEKTKARVDVSEEKYNKLPATRMTIRGTDTYEQVIFNTPSIVTVTYKIDHPVVKQILDTLTIDLSPYASDIAKASAVTRDMRGYIAENNFKVMYTHVSESLKKNNTEKDLSTLLKGTSLDFNNQALIWGVYLSDTGIATSSNLIREGLVFRRFTLYFTREKDAIKLDGLRISPAIISESKPSPTAKK